MFIIAINYRKKIQDKNLQLTENILSSLPDFVSEFIHNNEVSKSDNTLLSYARDIQSFFIYLVNNDERFSTKELEQLNVEDIGQLVALDIKNYERNLSKEKNLSNTSIKRKLSAVASL